MTRTLADRQPASPEIIAIASQKGGVGKSTTALSLSIALVAAGRNVLLMDLDPQGNTGHALMSGTPASGTERMLREATLTREMMTATEIPDLFLVPASPGLSGLENELAQFGDSRTRLHQALATLPALPFQFDHLVIDCPPSLGLLTLNALAAAHTILLPLPCESSFLDSLPTLLQTIGRLRAGLKQPLHGVHLLIARRTPSASSQVLVKTLRQDYGPLVLLTEIPYDDTVREAAERGLPLLAHCPHCDVSQAYLELAAEWLLGREEHQQPENRWSFRTRQERMARYRNEMRTRIHAWLMDPTSLLYDETWESHHQQDAQVLDELFHTESPPRRARFLVPLLLLLALSGVLLLQLRLPWWSSETEEVQSNAVPLASASEQPSVDQIGSAISEPAQVALKSAQVEERIDPELPVTDEETDDGATMDIVDTPAFDPGPSDPPSEIQTIELTPNAYRWQVQVLAGRSLEKVKEDGQRFMQAFASMLEGHTLTISQSHSGGTRDAFYRLRALDWERQSAAADWCNRLRARGQQCLVIRVGPGDR